MMMTINNTRYNQIFLIATINEQKIHKEQVKEVCDKKEKLNNISQLIFHDGYILKKKKKQYE